MTIQYFQGPNNTRTAYIPFQCRNKETKCFSNLYTTCVELVIPDTRKYEFVPKSMRGVVFETCSSEHMWQMLGLMLSHPNDRDKIQGLFSVDGVLSDWRVLKNWKGDIMDKTMKHYGELGIIAKMFTKLGEIECRRKFGVSNKKRNMGSPEDMWKIWRLILRAKFTRPDLRKKLMETGDYMLVETMRFTGSDEEGDKKAFWGAYVSRKEGRKGCLIGRNIMGKFLMRVREGIRLGKY